MNGLLVKVAGRKKPQAITKRQWTLYGVRAGDQFTYQGKAVEKINYFIPWKKDPAHGQHGASLILQKEKGVAERSPFLIKAIAAHEERNQFTGVNPGQMKALIKKYFMRDGDLMFLFATAFLQAQGDPAAMKRFGFFTESYLQLVDEQS